MAVACGGLGVVSAVRVRPPPPRRGNALVRARTETRTVSAWTYLAAT
jgi:hypothetical protein